MMIAINHDLIFLLCNTNFNRVYIYYQIKCCLSYICNSRSAANPCRFGKESKLIFIVTNVCVDTLGSLHK